MAVFDDVNDQWLTGTRRAITDAALRVARHAAAEQLIAGLLLGEQLTADQVVDTLLTRDPHNAHYDALQPYEQRWALLVIRATQGAAIEYEAVQDARQRGTTWAAIGGALGGVTPQAAQRRFKH